MRWRPAAANPLSAAAARVALTRVVAVALLAAPACRAEPPAAPSPPVRPTVRGFTEATAVEAVYGVPPYALAITDRGLERWDLRDGRVVRVEAGVAAAGPALGPAPAPAPAAIIGHELAEQRRALWLATDAGLARYDVDRGELAAVPPPPAALGLASLAGATLGAAVDGGVWVGLPSGLYYARDSGAWAATGIAAPVTDVAEVGGDLWVGTTDGLFLSDAGAAPTRLGPERGCDLASVRVVAPAPEGGVLVLGAAASGAARVVLARAGGCDSYRVSPARPWQAIAARPGEVLILAEGRIYALARPAPSPVRRLAREGLRLLPVPRPDGERPAASPFALTPLDVAVPAGARALASAAGEILVGTESLGIARLPARGGRAVAWLRGRELTAGAARLTVACRGATDCWIATGGRRAWRFDGRRFRPTADDGRRVLAVVAGERGAVHGVLASGPRVTVAAPDGDGWQGAGATVEAGVDPGEGGGGGGAVDGLAFARRSPRGALWLGLRGEGRRPTVAIVDLARGAARPPSARGRALGAALAAGVVDVAWRAGEPCLATASGLAHGATFEPVGGGVRRAVATPDGAIHLATGEGLATFDAGGLRPPRPLRGLNDLAAAPDGRLWLATDRGLALLDGARLRRLDRRRGLLEDRVLDLAVDDFGRVWLRGPEGISIVAAQ